MDWILKLDKVITNEQFTLFGTLVSTHEIPVRSLVHEFPGDAEYSHNQ